MTDHQKRCLLEYLGYDCGDLQAAILRFQQDYGLTADGIFGPLTRAKILEAICAGDDWWQDIAWFERGEFGCKCGGWCDGFPAEPAEKLVRTADRIRSFFGSAAVVSSGVRCARHNANVGGVTNSRHLTGKAMDFRIVGKPAAQVLSYVNQQPEIRYAYAIDENYVHMDVE